MNPINTTSNAAANPVTPSRFFALLAILGSFVGPLFATTAVMVAVLYVPADADAQVRVSSVMDCVTTGAAVAGVPTLTPNNGSCVLPPATDCITTSPVITLTPTRGACVLPPATDCIDQALPGLTPTAGACILGLLADCLDANLAPAPGAEGCAVRLATDCAAAQGITTTSGSCALRVATNCLRANSPSDVIPSWSKGSCPVYTLAAVLQAILLGTQQGLLPQCNPGPTLFDAGGGTGADAFLPVVQFDQCVALVNDLVAGCVNPRTSKPCILPSSLPLVGGTNVGLTIDNLLKDIVTQINALLFGINGQLTTLKNAVKNSCDTMISAEQTLGAVVDNTPVTGPGTCSSISSRAASQVASSACTTQGPFVNGQFRMNPTDCLVVAQFFTGSANVVAAITDTFAAAALASSSSFTEGAGTVDFLRITRTGSLTTKTIVFTTTQQAPATFSLTFYVNGVTQAADQLVIPTGSTTVTVSVRVNDDSFDQPVKLLTLSMVSCDACTVAVPRVFTASLFDEASDVPTITSFFVPAAGAAEGIVSTISFARSMFGTTMAVPVVLGGTAILGTHYTLSAATLDFNAGSTLATLSLTRINDNVDSITKTLVLTPAAGGSAYNVGTPANVNLLDNDAPLLRLLVSSPATEGDNLYFTVVRDLLSEVTYSGAVGVVAASTATQGTDYVLPALSFVLPSGPSTSSVARIPVRLLADQPNFATPEGTEQLVLTIGAIGPDPVVLPTWTTLSILDVLMPHTHTLLVDGVLSGFDWSNSDDGSMVVGASSYHQGLEAPDDGRFLQANVDGASVRVSLQDLAPAATVGATVLGLSILASQRAASTSQSFEVIPSISGIGALAPFFVAGTTVTSTASLDLYARRSSWTAANIDGAELRVLPRGDSLDEMGVTPEWFLDSLRLQTVLNVPPVLDVATQGAVTQEDTPVTHSFGLSDVNGDPARLILLSGPTRATLLVDGLTVSAFPHTLTAAVQASVRLVPQPDFPTQGSFLLTYTVQAIDAYGATSVPQAKTVSVSAVNDAPSASVMGLPNNRIPMTEGTPFHLTLSASDPDGDTLSVTILGESEEIAIVAAAGPAPHVTITPKDLEFTGNVLFDYEVCDPLSVCTGARRVYLKVMPVNDLPTIAVDPAGTVEWAEDSSASILLQVGDEETADDALEVRIATWSGPALTFSPGLLLAGSDVRSFFVRAGPDLFGEGTVTVVVTDRGAADNGFARGSATVSIPVRILSAPDPVAIDGVAASFEGRAIDVTRSAIGLFEVDGEAVDEGLPVSLTAFVREADLGETYTSSWAVSRDGAAGCDQTLAAPTLSFSGDATTAAGSVVSFVAPTFAANGSKVLCLRFEATGVDAITTGAIVRVLVTNAISVPHLTISGPAAATEGTLVVLDASGSVDEENDPLQFTWTVSPAVNLLGANTPTMSFTVPAVAGNQPEQAQAQRLVFRLTAADDAGTSAELLFTFTPVNLNRAPLPILGHSILFKVEDEAASFSAVGSQDPDVGDTPLAFLWSAPGLPFDGSTLALPLFTAPTIEPTTLSSANVPGVATYTVAVRVSDPSLAAATATGTLVVYNRNQPPAFTLVGAGGTTTLTEGATLALELAGGPTDPDNDQTFSYVWSVIPAGHGSFANPNSASPVFTAQQVFTSAGEDVTVQLRVSDTFGGFSIRTRTLHIANIPQAPTVQLTGLSQATESASVTLTAIGFDQDGDALSYVWRADPSNPVAVTLNTITANQVWFTAPDVLPTVSQQPYLFEVEVRDGVHTVTAAIVVTVIDDDNNRPAFVAVAPSGFAGSVAEGATAVPLEVQVTTGGDTLAHVATISQVAGPAVALSGGTASCNAPCGVSAFTVAAAFTAPTLATNQPVTLAFQVVVDDGVASFTQLLTYSVLNANGAPTASVPAFNPPVEDGPAVAIALSATDADADSLAITITVQGAHGLATVSGCSPATASPATCTLQYDPTEADYNGLDTVSVLLTDGYGGTTPVTVVLSIVPINDAPAFSGPSTDRSIQEDEVLVLTVQASDPDNARACGCDPHRATLAYAIASGPFHGTATVGADGVVTYTPGADYSGDDVILVTVTDGLASAQHPVYIGIATANDPPTFTPGALGFTLLEDGAGVSVTWATGLSPGPGEGPASDVSFLVGTDQPGLFAATPTVDGSGRLSFTLAVNANTAVGGAARIFVQARDPEGATSPSVSILVTVTAINDRPDFVKGPDKTTPRGDGPQTFSGWATGVVLGPLEEPSTQQVSGYLVTNNNPGLFSVQPSIALDGTLRYTPNPASAGGQALVTVRLQDNGGTANGGLDTSFARAFRITIT